MDVCVRSSLSDLHGLALTPTGAPFSQQVDDVKPARARKAIIEGTGDVDSSAEQDKQIVRPG